MFIRVVPAIVLLTLVGCAPKLNETRTYNLEPEIAEGFILPAQTKPQTVMIEFNSDNDVTVLLFKAADAKGDDGALMTEEKTALGFKKGTSGTFNVDVPENTETRLVVRGAKKKTKVDVKVKN